MQLDSFCSFFRYIGAILGMKDCLFDMYEECGCILYTKNASFRKRELGSRKNFINIPLTDNFHVKTENVMQQSSEDTLPKEEKKPLNRNKKCAHRYRISFGHGY